VSSRRLDHGLARGLRAAVLAVPAVGASSLAHGSVDRCADLIGVALALGLLWPAAVALVGGRRSVPALVAWLLGAQVVTHLVLDATCSSGGMSGVQHHLVAGSSPRMVMAHLLAATVTGVLLGRADGRLWWARALARALRRARRPVLPLVPVARQARVPVVHPAPVRSLWKAPHPVRRGPPALSRA